MSETGVSFGDRFMRWLKAKRPDQPKAPVQLRQEDVDSLGKSLFDLAKNGQPEEICTFVANFGQEHNLSQEDLRPTIDRLLLTRLTKIITSTRGSQIDKVIDPLPSNEAGCLFEGLVYKPEQVTTLYTKAVAQFVMKGDFELANQAMEPISGFAPEAINLDHRQVAKTVIEEGAPASRLLLMDAYFEKVKPLLDEDLKMRLVTAINKAERGNNWYEYSILRSISEGNRRSYSDRKWDTTRNSFVRGTPPADDVLDCVLAAYTDREARGQSIPDDFVERAIAAAVSAARPDMTYAGTRFDAVPTGAIVGTLNKYPELDKGLLKRGVEAGVKTLQSLTELPENLRGLTTDHFKSFCD